jgi:hypothetical protein
MIALALGVVGLVVSATGVATQLLPRQFTAAQQQQIKTWEVAARWRELPAGRIFPASVPYQLSEELLQDATPLTVQALRIAIAPQSGCSVGVTTATAAAMLRRDGCKAVLRATYVDATWSYVMTVGVAVLPSHAAAVSASQDLSRPRLTSSHGVTGTNGTTGTDRTTGTDGISGTYGAIGTGRAAGASRAIGTEMTAGTAGTTGSGGLAAGVRVVRFRGTAAAMYDYNRQISASFPDGPYLIMYAAGYTDNRPRVPLASDHYADAEMTSLAAGVAQSVANTLAAPPPSPHCPGAPGC